MKEPLERLQTQLLQRWHNFPAEQLNDLQTELNAALTVAATAEAEQITVMNPTSHPQQLQLAVLVSDAALDSMYSNEWAELAVSSNGRCFLLYRRRDGGDYAVEWSPATTLPTTMTNKLSPALAMALLGSDE